jgi:hypothetical protein
LALRVLRVKFPLMKGILTHDDPRVRCCGTDMAADAIHRAAAIIVDRNRR